MSYQQIKIITQVDVRKQMPSSQYVSFDDGDNLGVRVMFVGNSITLHEVNEGIGWLNTWGDGRFIQGERLCSTVFCPY